MEAKTKEAMWMTKIVAQSESVSSETAYQFKGVKKKKKKKLYSGKI